MKKALLNFVFILLISHFGFTQIVSSQRFIIADFTFSDTTCPDQNNYTMIQTARLGSTSIPGTPSLPVKVVNFIIPYGSRIDSILITESDFETIKLENLPFPVQQPLASCASCTTPPFQGIDSSVYFSNNSFPQSIVTASSQGLWNTANIASIAISPFQYQPSTNTVIFYHSITFSISLSIPPGAGNSPDTIRMHRGKYDNFIAKLKSLVTNTDMINLYLKGIEITDQAPKALGNLPANDYLVIAPDAYINSQAMKDLLLWKKKRGIDIAAVSIESIIGNNAPYYGKEDTIGNSGTFPNAKSINDPAAWLRMYLRDVNFAGGANWILLVGDENELPVRRFKPKSDLFDQHEPITDKYFADFNSDYAVDSDSFYGEFHEISGGYIGDDVDVYPESYVGRIPCSEVSEFGIWVNKLINYETNPGNGSQAYLGNFVMNMADMFQQGLQNSTDLYANLNMFNIRTFKEIPDWDSYSTTAPAGETIIQSLNTAPCGWWTWGNHGEENRIRTYTQGDNGLNTLAGQINTGAGTNGLLALTNNKKYGIIHSGSCSVASFGGSAPCMAEVSLFNPLGGSVAFSGCTDMSWIDWENPKLTNLAGIINASHYGINLENQHLCELDWNSYSYTGTLNSSQYETYMVHNLFADPEMLYYTKEPVRLDASVNIHHMDRTEINTISITINNLANGNKANVCLYKQKATNQPNALPEYQSVTSITGIPGNDVVTFTIPADSLDKGDLFVTVSGFNYLPFTDTILVSPGCGYVNSDEILTSTPQFPWNSVLFKDHNVIINPGVTLTITGKVYFVNQAKLIVKPGGCLIIDGGKLSASCEQLWQGVEVWGNNGQIQNVFNQGSVAMINQGSICDAVCGIRTVKIIGITVYPASSGGIVSCSNARFVNNKVAVKIYPFNYLGRGYNSSFTTTQFLINDKYISKTSLPDGMVYMSDMFGISFRGCLFENDNTLQTSLNLRGYGIKAYNAGFAIDRNCVSVQLPCTEYLPTIFNGLTYGVYAANYGALYPTSIQNSVFENNYRAVYLSAVYLPIINRNIFRTHMGSVNDTTSGLYLNACTGYSVQENTFTGHYSGITQTYETGIVVNNSGTASNEIYNNKFDGLIHGVLAQNKNRDATGLYGLVIKCNDFSAPNKYDIAVTKNNSNTGMGIKRDQGVDGTQTTDPAGNTFSYTWQNGESDYTNECENVTYIYHSKTGGSQIIPDHISNTVFPNHTSDPNNSYSKENSCPSQLNNGGGDISQLKLQQTCYDDIISVLTGQMIALKDGGNTQELKDDIDYSIPPEALDLYNSLIAKSPYLSDTILKEVIGKEDVLNTAMVTNILSANPHSAKNTELNEALDSRFNLLTDEQREDVDQGVFVLGSFESLQSRLSEVLAERAKLQYKIANNYLADTLGIDNLKLYLADQPDMWANRMLLMQYITDVENIDTNVFLQSISNTGLTTSQLNEWNDLTVYYSLRRQMISKGSLVPDSSQQITLSDLAEHNTSASVFADYLLLKGGQLVYIEPYIFPNGNFKSGRVIKHRQAKNNTGIELKLYPNPAIDYTILEYNSLNLQSLPKIAILDEAGRLIKSISMSTKSGIELISLTDLSPGTYSIWLMINYKPSAETKLVIVR